LVEAHPLQDEVPADDVAVIPFPPLLKKVHADIILFTSELLHVGHSGLSQPKTRNSKFLLHFSQ